MDFLSWFALAIIFSTFLALVYGIIAIHDIPYKIAEKRHHPHREAIHAAGWVSLFTLHAIWPILWIWAMAYDPEYGYAGDRSQPDLEQTNEPVESDPDENSAAAEPAATEVKEI